MSVGLPGPSLLGLPGPNQKAFFPSNFPFQLIFYAHLVAYGSGSGSYNTQERILYPDP
jgi:hypothetical protein